MNLRVFYNPRIVISAAQSSPALRRLPACALVFCLAIAPATEAQQRIAATTAYKAPGGVALADILPAARLAVSGNRGKWAEVLLDGWIFGRSVHADARQGLDIAVTERGGENLRAEPNGAIIARLRYGALLDRVEQREKWVHVRRRVWVPRSAVDAPMLATRATRSDAPAAYRPMAEQKADTQQRSARKGAAAPAAGPAQPPATPAAESVAPGADRVELARSTALYVTPDGAQAGTLAPGAPARILARSGDWVRVSAEGWVREADVKPAAGGALVGVSAAEVRANPDRYVGQVLDWRLQVISIQTADELRPEMSPGQTYVLTRGPLPEPGFVYVTIPADQKQRFRALGPLAELTLRLRIRAARSKYLATPVADLVDVVDSVAARR
jgi:hypothetical protein